MRKITDFHWITEKSCHIRNNQVGSFDTDEVVLVTEAGVLTVKGKDLHVIRLEVDKGELEMAGTIDSMVYSENHNVKKTAPGILGRMFK